MKFFVTLFCSLIFAFSASAQQAKPEILASANGRNYTAADLPPELREVYAKQSAQIVKLRQEILFEMAAEVLLATEAAARKITVEKLAAEIKAKAPAPTEAQIKAVYEQNRERIGDQSLERVKPEIVEFLRPEIEQKALFDYIATLNKKYKVAPLRDPNAPNLKPADVMLVIGAKKITAAAFEQKARAEIYELRANLYDAVSQILDEMIYSSLVAAEAEKENIASTDLIAREVTDKMRDYTTAERENLQNALRDKLFKKYNAKFLLKEPAPFVQNISVDDDPAKGNAAAPVTVVMFSDFQCPACAATHPVLQNILSEYGDRVRFVVRDFPLAMHKDGFAAAEAANAARAQGKFFEYIEILYQNQEALDRESFKKYAADLGLNVPQFELDLQSGKFAAEIRKDMADGQSYGVSGTPTIFVNGVKVRRLSRAAFRSAIDKALQKAARPK